MAITTRSGRVLGPTEETRAEEIDDEEENPPKPTVADKPTVINMDPYEIEKHPVVVKEDVCEMEKEKETPKHPWSAKKEARPRMLPRRTSRPHTRNKSDPTDKGKKKEKRPIEEETESRTDPKLEEALRKAKEVRREGLNFTVKKDLEHRVFELEGIGAREGLAVLKADMSK
ncbi:hypothetical protein HAX54_015862, partial [Datura stramonium]|nr:hypothetical protein [Datura stramonium]